ncbi:hypothetical protein GA830_10305 [Mesorhizobium sp. NBSH29]|uniref:hypothetical protein n=1 Tax=Mesorhizobium sp. NBSH29 TaxID=2654249 RepID=UPI0018C17760|nr:hypothetical protein [Mesorhizobium sp. NBSH29]QPC87087.1 hypothetical protein GA830_10305 [Mesorhizobium sp. NBSH29]
MVEGEKPAIKTDEQREALVTLSLQAAKLIKKVDETRLLTTKPLREEVEETNKFFTAIVDRPTRVKSSFDSMIGDYDSARRDAQRREAAAAARKAEEIAKAKLDEATQVEHSVQSDVVMNEAAAAENFAQKMAALAVTAGSGPVRTEAGTVFSTKTWEFRVTDWAKLDLRELRDSFTSDEIEKAIRKHVRTHKNTKPLAGVTIFQDEKTRLRG